MEATNAITPKPSSLPSKPFPFSKLSDDLFRLILTFVDVEEAGKMEYASTNLRDRIHHDELLWRKLGCRRFKFAQSKDWSWRDLTVIFMQRKKGIFIKEQMEYVVHPVRPPVYNNGLLHYIAADAIKSYDPTIRKIVSQKRFNAERTFRDIEYFDGDRAVFSKEIDKVKDPATGAFKYIVDETTGQRRKQTDVNICDRNLNLLHNFKIKGALYNVSIIGKKLLNKPVISYQYFNIHDFDQTKPKITVHGNIIAYRYPELWVQNDGQILIYNSEDDAFSHKTVALPDPFPGNDRDAAIAGEILVLLCNDHLIGYQLPNNLQPNPEWVELWRKDQVEAELTRPDSSVDGAPDGSPLIRIKVKGYEDLFRYYNAITGEEMGKEVGKTQTFLLNASFERNKHSSMLKRDYSPLRRYSKRKSQLFKLAKLITFCFLAIFTCLVCVKLFNEKR